MQVPSTSEKSTGALSLEFNLSSPVSELQLKLQESIEEENYEQAAQLRDQLKELEESTANRVIVNMFHDILSENPVLQKTHLRVNTSHFKHTH